MTPTASDQMHRPTPNAVPWGGRRDSRDTTAHVIAAVLSPAVLAGAVLAVAGYTDSGWWGLLWAGLTAAVVVGLPMAVLIYLSHRGTVETRYVRAREQRLPVYGGVCLLMVAVLIAQYLLGPRLGIPLSVTLTASFLLLGLVVLMVITLAWKVSAHTSVAATFAVAIPVLTVGWLIAITWVVPVAVAWSRIRTGDHTYWQTVVGMWIGILLGAFHGIMWHLWI